MAKTTYRIALMGCGRMGRSHTIRLHEDGRARVVAAYDVDRETAESLRNELAPEAMVYDSVDQLLDVDQLDAVVVCTPTTAHFDQVQACRARGLPVLCEKPLADSAERTRQLIHESESGPLLTVAYQRRSWGTYRTLAREVRSGRWGPIQAITSHNTEYWQQTIAGTWRDDPAVNPGGFLGDAGSHKLDALFLVTGLKADSVFARSDHCGSHVPIVTTALVVSDGGIPIMLSFIGNAHHLSEDLQIHCRDADLMIRDWRVWIAQNNTVEPLTPLEPHSEPAVTFLDVLDGRIENPAPAGCAWPVWTLTQAILQSSRSGQIVDVEQA